VPEDLPKESESADHNCQQYADNYIPRPSVSVGYVLGGNPRAKQDEESHGDRDHKANGRDGVHLHAAALALVKGPDGHDVPQASEDDRLD